MRLRIPRSAPAAAGPRAKPPSAVPDAWGALMTAAQDGHGGAYRRLLAEIGDWATRYFSRRLPPGEIDDAVQETLLAVHRRRHTYDPSRPFAPWLAAIAKRKWVDQLRSLERGAAQDLPDEIATADHESAVTSATVLAGLLAALPPAQAQAVLLVKLHGYPVADASRESGQSVAAVKVNVHRGLARLAKLIAGTDHVE